MIISKYPYLVQDEILCNMECSDIFLLSFASKNMKKSIYTSKRNRFKRISSITYDCLDTDQPYVHINYDRRWDTIMRIMKHEEDGYFNFQLNVCGKSIDFGSSDQCNYYIASFYPCDKESVIKSIYNYFLDFFGNSVEYYWQSENMKYLLRPFTGRLPFFVPFIPQLQNLSLCVSICIKLSWIFADMKTLENFLTHSPVFKSVFMKVRETTEPFNPESKLYQAKYVVIDQDELTAPDILRYLKGDRQHHQRTLCPKYTFGIMNTKVQILPQVTHVWSENQIIVWHL
ncbi:Protein CBG10130 [Caenorhabditis briggsae]|uniref:Protein CBG10130 n=1 Tax=Caenorhabditis briggsae TaxID=6238 RepID=A8XAG4_CAEBR|nr:Protein CBG10130 [Caenorhabditis briggsae]CAP29632.1 Protein CBG10130 [Caenorhabditis briggsae]